MCTCVCADVEMSRHLLTFTSAFPPPFLVFPDDLIRNRMKPPPNWRHGFAEYISTLPSYYAQVSHHACHHSCHRHVTTHVTTHVTAMSPPCHNVRHCHVITHVTTMAQCVSPPCHRHVTGDQPYIPFSALRRFPDMGLTFAPI